MDTMHRFTWTLLSLPLVACSGAEGAGVAVRASAVQSPGDLVAEDDGGTVFAIEAASLAVRDIRLDLPDGTTCGDIEELLVGAHCEPSDDAVGGEDTIVIDGPFAVDLTTGVATPGLEDVVIPAGLYRRIDVRADDAGDVTFAVSAAFELDGAAHHLELALDFNEDIRLEDPAGVEIGDDSDLIAELVVDDWLAGIDIGACVADGDAEVEGTVVYIDEGSTSGDCSDIENVIKDNLKRSGQLDRF